MLTIVVYTRTWMINTETPEVRPHNATFNFPTNKPFHSMQVRSVTSVLLKAVLNSIRVSEGKLQFKRSDWHFKRQKRELFSWSQSVVHSCCLRGKAWLCVISLLCLFYRSCIILKLDLIRRMARRQPTAWF